MHQGPDAGKQGQVKIFVASDGQPADCDMIDQGLYTKNLSYRADYENAVGEEKVLRRAAAEKKCDLPPPPAPPAAPGAAPVFQSDQGIR